MKPNPDILTREISNEEYKKLLGEVSRILEECVNFGTNVMAWANEGHKNDYSDISIILMYRYILETVDGISVMVKTSCINPIKPLLRVLFETFIGLEYILEDDTINRALAYQVDFIRKKLLVLDKLDLNTQQGEQFLKSLEKDMGTHFVIKSNLESYVQNDKEAINELLNEKDYLPINQEWNRIREKNKRNPDWFSLFDGPRNIERLANYLERGVQYELIYRELSQAVHGKSAISQIGLNNTDEKVFKGLRNPDDFENQIFLVLMFVLESTYKIINYYSPNKLSMFKEWYEEEVRDWYLRLSSKEKIIKYVLDHN